MSCPVAVYVEILSNGDVYRSGSIKWRRGGCKVMVLSFTNEWRTIDSDNIEIIKVCFLNSGDEGGIMRIVEMEWKWRK